jgi:methyl-accepting chemotaxis protein
MSQTLRSKIIVMLLLISLVPVLTTGIISYVSSKEILSNKLESTSMQTVEEVRRGIDNYFSAVSNIVTIMSEDIVIKGSNKPETFEYSKKFISNVEASDVNILTTFIGTENNMYYTYPETKIDSNYDFKSRVWYTDALKNTDKINISNPYESATTGKIVVSISKAIINDSNEIVGVVGINLDLEQYSNSLSNVKIGKSGYLFIADELGNLIAHPDQTLIGTDTPATLSFWPEVSTNKAGFTKYNFKGDNRFGAYQTSDTTGWKIVATMYESELTNDTEVIFRTITYSFIILLIASVVIAIWFSNPISHNIKKLLNAFQNVANGDMTVKVDIKSKDEFKLLGEQFNDMVSNISVLLGNVKGSSDTVLETSVMLANMAEETNASVNEVVRAVEEVAHGATEQAQYSSDSVTTISDLSDNLNMVDEATEYIYGLTKNTKDLTDRGFKGVESLIYKSNETKTSTEKVSELVYEMNNSTNQINAISDTINNITAQTNLLALNASIEAARAGEAGKGFAVVADEIRDLAEQSKVSTIQIKAIVEDIKRKTELAVEAMGLTGKNVEEQVIVVDQTQTIFKEIMQGVEGLSEKVSEIRVSISDIAKKKENVISRIESISAISEETASASEEVSASTAEIARTMDEITQCAVNLQDLSQNLQTRLGSFKL